MLAKLSYKGKLLSSLQLAIILGAFSYIFRKINWDHALVVVNRIEWRWVSLAFICSFLTFIPMANRYSYLLRATTINYSLLKAYRGYLAGAFVSLVVPSSISGDMLRIWLCNRDSTSSLIHASAVAFIERLLGIIALIILMKIGMQYAEPIKFQQLSMVISLITILLVLSIILIPSLIHYLAHVKIKRKNNLIKFVQTKIPNLREKVIQMQSIGVFNLYVGLCLSIMAQIIDVLCTYFLAQGLGFNLNVSIFFLVLPLTYLMTVIPLSPGGLGLREGAFVIALTLFHVPTSEAVLLALSVFFNRLIVGLVGGINAFFYHRLIIK